MKKLFFSLIAVLAFTIAALSSEYRAFTNKEGNTIHARIAQYDAEDGRIQLELKNHKKAWVELSSLSEEDQTYIRKFAASAFAETRTITLTKKSSILLNPEKSFRVYEKFSARNDVVGVDFMVYASTNKTRHFSTLSAQPTITNKCDKTVAVSVNFVCLSNTDEIICSMYQGIEVEAGETITLNSCMSLLPSEAIAEIKKYKVTVYTETVESK